MKIELNVRGYYDYKKLEDPEKVDDGVWVLKGIIERPIEVGANEEKEKKEEKIFSFLFDPKKFKEPGDVMNWLVKYQKENEDEDEVKRISLEDILQAFNKFEKYKKIEELKDKEI